MVVSMMLLRNGSGLVTRRHSGVVKRMSVLSSKQPEQQENEVMKNEEESNSKLVKAKVSEKKLADVKESVSHYHPSAGIVKFHADRLMEPKPKLEEPVIKNFAIGKVNNKLFEYPEFDSKQDLSSAIEFTNMLENYFKETGGSDALAENQQRGMINKHVLQTLRSFGLFGLEIPVQYGGLQLEAKKLLRIYETIAARDMSILATISAHNNLAVKAILLYGNEEQKQKYLPKLATGEMIGAFCLTEAESGMDAAMMQMKADASSSEPFYILNGKKTWVTNASIADLFIVFAQSRSNTSLNLSSAFIVERDFGGITVGEPKKTVGLKHANCICFFPLQTFNI